MAQPTHYFIRLTKGSTFRTPWGQSIRKGQALKLSATSPRLAYFENLSRFRVTESVTVARSGRARVPVRQRTKTKKPEATGLLALTRPQLVKAARELGLNPRSSDNKPDIVKMMEDHNAALVQKAEKDKAAADASEARAKAEAAERAETAAAEEAEAERLAAEKAEAAAKPPRKKAAKPKPAAPPE